MNEEHRRKISEAMKRRYQEKKDDKEFQEQRKQWSAKGGKATKGYGFAHGKVDPREAINKRWEKGRKDGKETRGSSA